MSTYLFQEARIGDVVELDGQRMEVKRNQGHCPLCFFHKRICSGVACTSWEREEGTPAYYKPITKRKKSNHHHPSPNTPKNHGTT